MNLNFYMPTKIITGKDCIKNNKDVFSQFGKNCLIVTGKTSAKKCGALDDVTNILEELNIKYDIFNGIEQNPTYASCLDAALLAKKMNAEFIIGIGGKLSNGEPHDNRAPDYDDWSTPNGDGFMGLNGDLLIWYPILGRSIELSSMGIRVDKEALMHQLELQGKTDRKELYFHRRLLEGTLPLSIGGGIGQSRLCMILLQKGHVGETQSSIWPEDMRQKCKELGMNLI